MNPWVRTGLISSLLLAVVLSCSLLVDHFDRQDEARALMVVKLARFGETTRSRLDLWFETHRVNPQLRWTSVAPGLFDATVAVRLSVQSQKGSESYDMAVNPVTREVVGRDAKSRALLMSVRAWAKTL